MFRLLKQCLEIKLIKNPKMCKSCVLPTHATLYRSREENEIEFFILLEMTVIGYLYKKYIFSCNSMKLHQFFTILC